MSGLLQPQGPQPTRVYWIRRAVLLLIVFAVVFAVGRLVTGGGSDPQQATKSASHDKTTSSAPSTTTSPSATATSSATPSTSSTPPATASAKPSTAPATPSGKCAATDVTVAPEPTTSQAGGEVSIPLVFSSSQEACEFTVSADTVAVKISSGPAAVWTTQQCHSALAERKIVLRNGSPVRVPIKWSGRMSDKNCTAGTRWAQPGAYHVSAAALGSNPTDVQFDLVKPKPRVVIKEKKPAPSTTAKPSATATPAR